MIITKHVSRLKYFNNHIDTSKQFFIKVTFVRHKPKVNLVRFFDPFYHINTIEKYDEDHYLAN